MCSASAVLDSRPPRAESPPGQMQLVVLDVASAQVSATALDLGRLADKPPGELAQTPLRG